MAEHNKSLLEYSIEELDQELVIRGARIPEEQRFQFNDNNGSNERNFIMGQVKELYDAAASEQPNPELQSFDDNEIVETLTFKLQEINGKKGIWGDDDRMDYFKLKNETIKTNANSVAVLCLEDNLRNTSHGLIDLKTKKFGQLYNLCQEEPFRSQDIAPGVLGTGFLVKEDVIATAGHCTNRDSVKDLRFIFDFRLNGTEPSSPRFASDNIYKGKRIIARSYDPKTGSDWALVQLDRKVKGHLVVNLSKNSVFIDQPVYTLGHPCGLPLKYSGGAFVRKIDKSFFSADLSVYGGNSGSPVFDSDTHEVIGMVVRGDGQDFRWTVRGWLSIIYPNPRLRTQKPQCTKISEFIDFCR